MKAPAGKSRIHSLLVQPRTVSSSCANDDQVLGARISIEVTTVVIGKTGRILE